MLEKFQRYLFRRKWNSRAGKARIKATIDKLGLDSLKVIVEDGSVYPVRQVAISVDEKIFREQIKKILPPIVYSHGATRDDGGNRGYIYFPVDGEIVLGALGYIDVHGGGMLTDLYDCWPENYEKPGPIFKRKQDK